MAFSWNFKLISLAQVCCQRLHLYTGLSRAGLSSNRLRPDLTIRVGLPCGHCLPSACCRERLPLLRKGQADWWRGRGDSPPSSSGSSQPQEHCGGAEVRPQSMDLNADLFNTSPGDWSRKASWNLSETLALNQSLPSGARGSAEPPWCPRLVG